MRLLRPLSLSIPSIGLSLIFLWFAMAGVDYVGTRAFPSFTTAGWFILGSPLVLALSVGFAKVVVELSGKRYWFAGQFLMAGVVVLTGVVIWFKLPANLVSSIIGSDLADGVIIHRLRSVGSFSDGEHTYGEISGREDLLKSIIDRKALQLMPSSEPRQVRMALGEPVPDAESVTGPDMAYHGKGCSFYRDPENGRIYFWSRRG